MAKMRKNVELQRAHYQEQAKKNAAQWLARDLKLVSHKDCEAREKKLKDQLHDIRKDRDLAQRELELSNDWNDKQPVVEEALSRANE